MQSTEKTRLHPLLTAAAISVTVFSAVGIASITGLLPSSSGKEAPVSAAAVEAIAPAPSEIQTPPVPEAPSAPQAPVQAQAVPAPKAKPAKKHVAHRSAPAHRAAAHEEAKIAEAPAAAFPAVPAPAPALEAPKPPPGLLGVVESVSAIDQPAEKSNGVGPIVGGIAGALLGHQVGHGTGRTIATVLGAAGGALAGKEVEKNVNKTRHWEVHVRLDDGTTRTLRSDAEPFWHGGERVRLLDGRLTPA